MAAASVAAAAWPCGRSWAAEVPTKPAFVETRLFNLRDNVSPGRAEEAVHNLRSRVAEAGFKAATVGRNFVPTPFATRFEWVTIVQWPDFAGLTPPLTHRLVQDAMDELKSLGRNYVRSDLPGALPPAFSKATSGNVRHTVMFTFNADASPDVRSRIISDIREMGRLPMVQAYLVEPCSPYLAGSDQMEWQVLGDYRSKEDYKSYSDAPNHLAIRDVFVKNTSKVAFLDTIL